MGTSDPFFDAIGTAFTDAIAWVGQFMTALTSGSLSGLLIPLCIGIGISLVMVCVKIVRKITWGA